MIIISTYFCILNFKLNTGGFTTCTEACEAPELCRGPFILDNGIRTQEVGYYCVDALSNNPAGEGCEDVIVIYPVPPTEGKTHDQYIQNTKHYIKSLLAINISMTTGGSVSKSCHDVLSG